MKDKEYQTAELKRHAAQMADKRGGYFDTVGSVSEGEATHKLTGGESGTSAHTHSIVASDTSGGATTVPQKPTSQASNTTITTAASTEANADDAHNNIQPSYVCYVWRRTV